MNDLITGRFFRKSAFNRRNIFLLDDLGALLTAILLIIVIAALESNVGMPRSMACKLSILAFCYSVYSLSCYFFKPINWAFYLKVIIVANCIYCCLTLVLVGYFYGLLTLLGVAYFSVEIAVIVLLILLEVMIVRNKY